MKLKKTLSVLLTLCMLLSVQGLAAYSDDARPVNAETVSYIDENGEPQTVEAVALTPGAGLIGAAGETNWYVLEGEYTGDSVIHTFDAVANLILADGASWTITNQNTFNLISENGSLRLFAQENGTGTLRLSSRIYAGSGDVAIFGGNVTTTGLMADTRNGTLSVFGGVVHADGLYTKDLIIAGGETDTASMTVNGTVTVSGGKLNVQSANSMALMSTGDILISGGTVTSVGMNGLYSSSGSVSITGGSVTATGRSMGISAASGVSISGGTVNATGNTMGLFSRGPISVTGGTVNISGNTFGVYPSAEDAVVTLGADTPDSSYTFSGFLPNATVTVKDGQTLTDGENDYSGTLSAEQVAALADATLTCKHLWNWVIDDEPTCGAAGKKHEVCSVCGKTQSENTVLAPTGAHTGTIVNAKEATATEDGYTGDTVCTVCGQTLAVGAVIPATGEAAPDEPTGSDGACLLCGETHDGGLFDGLLGIIHLVIYILTYIYGVIR